MIWDSLKKAASDYKSISFPAIGTGNLGFKKGEVAKIMIDAVEEFAKRNTKKKLDVNLVVFPEDNGMMEVIYANYILCFSVFEPSFSISILIMFYFHPPHKYFVQHSF